MKYRKYKDFLPETLRVKNVNKINKSNKRAIMILLILNVAIFPLNTNKIFFNKEKDIIYYNEYENGIATDSIATWLEIDSNIIYNMNIDNGEGELSLRSWEAAYNIEEKGFDISEIKAIDDNILVKVVKR